MAVTAVLIVLCPVRITTSASGSSRFAFASTSSPPTPSMIRSVMMMSKTCSSMSFRPSAAAGGHHAVVADPLEALGHGRGVRLVVVDHQDADLLIHRSLLALEETDGDLRVREPGPRAAESPEGPLRSTGPPSHTGSRTLNCEPLPSSLCTSIAPPCASMIFRVVGKPRPLPPGASREERVEDPRPNLLGHPHPGVDHVEPDPRPLPPGRQNQLAPAGHRVLGVQDQVQERLLEQVAIELDQGQVAGKRGADHDPLGCRVRLVEISQLVDDRVQVGRLELQLLHPGEPQEALENAMQPVDFGPKPLEPLQHSPVARRLRVLKILEQAGRGSARASRAGCGSRVPGRRQAARSRRIEPAAAGSGLARFDRLDAGRASTAGRRPLRS